MNVMSDKQKQVNEPQQTEQSPISILHEIFSGADVRPSYTFSVHRDCSSSLIHNLLWQCTVEVPNHGYGCGTSYSKKCAKSKACLNILAKLGHDVPKLENYDLLINNNLEPQVANDQAVALLPPPSIGESFVDGQCKLERCFNSCCILNVKCDPDGELKPHFFRLYLAAISMETRIKHGITREQNPCGYLEMLCKRIGCEQPTFACEFRGPIYVTTAKLGPWTATGSAPNKKHSKYIACSSLISGIEDHGKQH